ncbi:oxygen-independent coproporphyrinogen III oxidase [Legionella cherrii]|uniref:Coproporphyrinogen-III oxidase n=1 Tax=Legionella cherrii TaxID=28084 RepID=A0A0W0SDB0_9GAMM|nr:oxygen-independent coproporphyrinogen III oxidase [Legionella cherrii]KTC81137.1 oxygen-independent coproporphyrinogen III oxidase [Legionella cherrii]VEB33570.1 oxygen-independent coproporphyrinogen III oxidase [Legionella cherrii]
MFLNDVSEHLILNYEGQFPRYTSYPTAPHFSTEINAATYSQWLGEIPEQDTLSLYVHIPFCQQLCWYCGCYTKINNKKNSIEEYIKVLTQEIALVAKRLSPQTPYVTHIHFGGGSPTILPPQLFLHLMNTLREAFNVAPHAEIAIEVDPRTVNEEKINAYATALVNRISIGAQDFNPEVQLAINRVQPFELVQSCVNLFKQYGMNNINLDLIYGLPKQTRLSIKNNIEAVTLLDPDRIAFFAYAHVHWMKKHMQLIQEKDLPNAAERIEMFALASELLKQKGYVPVGLDHFAKPTDSMALALSAKSLKRNFQGYSVESASHLIGLGTSSISQLRNRYVQNTSELRQYKNDILNQVLPIVRGIEISVEDQLRKSIINDIMCYLEVDLKKKCTEFHYPQDYFANELRSLDHLVKDGLVLVNNDVIQVHPKARQITRVVSSYFDRFFKSDAQKHSRIT